MEAHVIRKLVSGVHFELKLTDGTTIRIHRGQIPWRGPIQIGTKLDVQVAFVPMITDVSRPN